MLRRPGSIKLMNVFGIRIGVDATWFLILFLMIIWISGAFRQTLPLHTSDTVVYATTVVTALLFFGSLILHELGHALVARREGIEVKRIELFLFGGITQMSRDARRRRRSSRSPRPGPLATFLFVLLCLAVDLAIVGPHRLVHAAELDGTVRVTPVLLGLSWLLLMNVLILIFNLVPAFPLDGGRIARAIVWHVTDDKQRGTRVAAKVGQWFAVLLAGLGIAWMLTTGSLGGLWLVALAFLLGQSARGALVQSALTQRIEGVRVADIMDRQPVAIAGHDAGHPGARRVLPALRLVVVPRRRRERPIPGDRAPGARAGRARRRRGLADRRRGGRERGRRGVAGPAGPPADRASVLRAARPTRGADGRRRRGRAPRRGHGRAGPAGAAIGARPAGAA